MPQLDRLTLRIAAFIGAAAYLAAAPALAVPLIFAAPATVTATRTEPLASHALPIGPWDGAGVPSRIIEGRLTRTAWRIDAPGVATLALLAPLRDQLAAAGFRAVWDCATDACGGFDFRFAIDVIAEPDMHVDLGDFRFLAAERSGPQGPEAISLLVSRSAANGFVQVVTVGTAQPDMAPDAAGAAPVPPQPTSTPTPGPTATELGDRMQADGFVVLEDLVFASGLSVLDDGSFASLDALAAFLRADPGRGVTLVGHTDASGGLAGNTALSRARAAAVRARLIADYDVSPDQVLADGVGPLAPRATNLTEDGRARNRRVEAVLTPSG